MLKGDGVQPVEHTEMFYLWLKSVNTAPGSRAGVVKAIAAKLNITFVGLYDEDAYLE